MKKNIFELTDIELNELTDDEVKDEAYTIRYYNTDFYNGDVRRADQVLRILGSRLNVIEAAEREIKNTPENIAKLDAAIERAFAQDRQQEQSDNEEY